MTKPWIKRRNRNIMVKFAQRSLATTPMFYVTNVLLTSLYICTNVPIKFGIKHLKHPVYRRIRITRICYSVRVPAALCPSFARCVLLFTEKPRYLRERAEGLEGATSRGAGSGCTMAKRRKRKNGWRAKKATNRRELAEQESEREVHGERRLIGGYEGERKKQGEK